MGNSNRKGGVVFKISVYQWWMLFYGMADLAFYYMPRVFHGFTWPAHELGLPLLFFMVATWLTPLYFSSQFFGPSISNTTRFKLASVSITLCVLGLLIGRSRTDEYLSGGLLPMILLWSTFGAVAAIYFAIVPSPSQKAIMTASA
jgi:hypothetical protein